MMVDFFLMVIIKKVIQGDSRFLMIRFFQLNKEIKNEVYWGDITH